MHRGSQAAKFERSERVCAERRGYPHFIAQAQPHGSSVSCRETATLRVGLPENTQGLRDNPEDGRWKTPGGKNGWSQGITEAGKRETIPFGDVCAQERTVTVTCF